MKSGARYALFIDVFVYRWIIRALQSKSHEKTLQQITASNNSPIKNPAYLYDKRGWLLLSADSGNYSAGISLGFLKSGSGF